jgi:hypothetical protein
MILKGQKAFSIVPVTFVMPYEIEDFMSKFIFLYFISFNTPF